MTSTKGTTQQGAHEHTPAQHYNRDSISRQSAFSKAPVYQPNVSDNLIKTYLNLEQTAVLCPILRILKKRYQEELCISLTDYIETGIPDIPDNFLLGALFMRLTRVGLPDQDDPADKTIIRPLRNTVNN